MKKVLIFAEVFIENNEDFKNLKQIEHHAERLFDLESWPEIKAIQNVQVKKAGSMYEAKKLKASA